MDFTQNYFEIFGLPVDFSVDRGLLSARYLELQKHLHPDNFIGSTDQEKRLSMQWSTLVNTAHITLRDPLKCAIYMLQLHQIDIAENPSLPADFLKAQIALREELEAIENNPTGIEKLGTFKSSVDSVMKSLQTDFVTALNDDPQAAAEVVYKLQFIHKLRLAADHLEEKLLGY